MAYSRPNLVGSPPAAEVLTARLAGIGFNLAATPEADADIEATLVLASVEGLIHDDLRVLALLTTWLGVHHAYVNVARLRRAVGEVDEERVRAYWAAIALWLAADRRFRPLAKEHSGEALDLLTTGTAFQIRRRGEDPRFEGSSLRVPAGVLRDRAADVISPERLAAIHRGYRNRVRMGPTWRSDLWTALEADPGLRPSDAARRVGCSFAVAWEAVRDFALWRSAKSGTGNR